MCHSFLFLFLINVIRSFSMYPLEIHGDSPIDVRQGCIEGTLADFLSRLGLTLVSLYKNNKRTGQ